MAKLTKEQVNRWNAKLQNGFTFDIPYFLNWGDKQIAKRIWLEDGKILEARIIYRDVRSADRVSSTGRVHPALHLQVWKSGSTPGMMYSTGMGAYIDIGEEQPKRKYNELVKLSATIDDDKIMAYAKENEVALSKEEIY